MSLSDDMLDDLANAMERISEAGYMTFGNEDGGVSVHDPDRGSRVVAEVFHSRAGVTWGRK